MMNGVKDMDVPIIIEGVVDDIIFIMKLMDTRYVPSILKKMKLCV